MYVIREPEDMPATFHVAEAADVEIGAGIEELNTYFGLKFNVANVGIDVQVAFFTCIFPTC